MSLRRRLNRLFWPDHFWRHDRPGSYRFSLLVCFLLGHCWEYWDQAVDENGVFVAEENAYEIVPVHGDCSRCWA